MHARQRLVTGYHSVRRLGRQIGLWVDTCQIAAQVESALEVNSEVGGSKQTDRNLSGERIPGTNPSGNVVTKIRTFLTNDKDHF